MNCEIPPWKSRYGTDTLSILLEQILMPKVSSPTYLSKIKSLFEWYVMTVISRIIVWHGSSVSQHIAPYRINHCINFHFTDSIHLRCPVHVIYNGPYSSLVVIFGNVICRRIQQNTCHMHNISKIISHIKYAHTEQNSIAIDFRIMVIYNAISFDKASKFGANFHNVKYNFRVFYLLKLFFERI